MKAISARKIRPRGFALVVTLSLLILLTVIAVGLLSLATVSLRSSGQGEVSARARANAKLALMLALGDLQAGAGPDTRITAPGSILEDSHPSKQHAVGVWESRKFDGSDLPSEDSYSQDGKAGKFKRWLVSAPDPIKTSQQEYAKSGAPPAEDRATLIPEIKSEGGSIDAFTAELVKVSGNLRGSYAYAVLDEGIKARIDTGFRPPAGEKAGDKAVGLATGARPDAARIKGLEKIDWKAADLTETGNLLPKVVSRSTGALFLKSLGGSAEDYPQSYHDTTTLSLGLFTDVANGGLKEDLNSILNANGLPATYSGQNAKMYTSHLNYPVASNSTFGQGEPSWAQIFSFANSYKTLLNKNGGATLAMKAPPSWTNQTTPPAAFQQTATMMPSVLKAQIFYSLIAVPLARDGNITTKPATAGQWTDSETGLVAWASTAWDKGARYFMMICMAPVVTLHNPYNVNLEVNNLSVEMNNVPVSIQLKRTTASGESGWVPAKGQGADNIDTESKERPKTTGRKFIFDLANAGNPVFTLAPGEVRMFSATAPSSSSYASNPYRSWNNFTDPVSAQPMKLDSGFRGVTIGFYAPRVTANELTGYESYPHGTENRRGSLEYLAPGDIVRAKVRPCLDKRISSGAVQKGVCRVALVKTGGSAASAQVYSVANFKVNTTKEEGNLLTGLEEALGLPSVGQEISGVPASTFAIASGTAPLNTLSAYTFGVATISAKTTYGNFENKSKDGTVAAKPLAFHSAASIYTSADVDKTGLEPYAYEPGALALDSANGTGFENYLEVNAQGRSYGISGLTAQRGLQFGTLYEVPTGPLSGFNQLNSANVAGWNSAARFANPIGNSWASPSIPPDKISQAISGLPVAQDHSFLLNSLLYDKFYFSGLANRQGNFITSVSQTNLVRSMVEGNTTRDELDPRFVPHLPDGETQEDAIAILSVVSTSNNTDPQARTRAAAHQLMKGAFNVNSTSKAAWKAMLASLHAAGAKKFAVDESSTNAKLEDLKEPGKSQARFSRFSIPNSDAPESSSDKLRVFQGPRDITEAELDSLSEEIVKQVKERGPFLSMGEFVNRQLGTSDLCQKGALQSAIDATSINGDDSVLASTGYKLPEPSARYLNPKAMEGRSDQGAAGYLTQADLLTVLGNAATVRSDTFTIRAYGDARDASNKIIAKAWCEAVVQRIPDYVSGEDGAHVLPADLKSEASKMFGRRFQITSFRWVSPSEMEPAS
ncbi:MAG: hypothetical protein EOP88_02340 [Verrucomicrobiaceae bacterium]|nr:MAG: hypothetical protein EOP88_02340 [Verrucomicrobiaceae bacterium]